jgi:hypothetical protein
VFRPNAPEIYMLNTSTSMLIIDLLGKRMMPPKK